MPEHEGNGDMLRRLEERLDRASSAAERLISEAASAAGSKRPTDPPPAGWQAPDAGAETSSRTELEVLTAFLRSVRDLIPPELQRRLGEALRELLLAVRALIDWYLERIEQRRTNAPEVRDIPIL